MLKFEKVNFFFLAFAFLFTGINSSFGKVDKIRIIWDYDAATGAVISWNQVSGGNAKLYFGTRDGGTNIKEYNFSKAVTSENAILGMKTKFVRLNGLQPFTDYYFVIADNEGVSKRYSFTTAPADDSSQISIVSGGDSRNYRDVRQNANRMVAKVQPTCVLFSGDMTDNSSPSEWKAWLDDWQLTISPEGRITPLIVARGNHEPSNKIMQDVFGIRAENIYYSVKMGGDLLNILTLNTLHPTAPAQTNWLRNELRSTQHFTWHIAHYHHTISPHTTKKKIRMELLNKWAVAFYEFGLNLAVESDAHVMKSTYPVKPALGAGSERGFERAEDGTVYIGEGCWGAPLRDANVNNSWTKHKGKFNQFRLIFVDKSGIEVRVIPTKSNVANMPSFNPKRPFVIPSGFPVWKENEGGVVRISNPEYKEDIFFTRNSLKYEVMDVNQEGQVATLVVNVENEPPGAKLVISRSDSNGAKESLTNMEVNGESVKKYTCTDALSGGGTVLYTVKMLDSDNSVLFNEEVSFTPKVASPVSRMKENALANWQKFPRLDIGADRKMRYAFSLANQAGVSIKVLRGSDKSLVKSFDLPSRSSGKYIESLATSSFNSGEYILLIFSNKQLIRRYRFKVD